jgi:hypothetical protein
MLFFKNQPEEEKHRYEKLLQIICSLSRLSSDSDIPYLYYRMAENIFCMAFSAKNVARSNMSLDVRKGDVGIGLKTFISKGTATLEKIAEFNKDKHSIDKSVSEIEKIKIISRLRNKRLKISSNICNVKEDSILYHCVLRAKDKLLVCEQEMPYIEGENIKIIPSKGNTVFFEDGINEYMFNFSKSTLYKRFFLEPIKEIPVKIYDDPYKTLEDCFKTMNFISEQPNFITDTIYLPLYSEKGGSKYVPQRSGLNQWHAKGRPRNANEVYIPIPKIVNTKFPDFFPKKDQQFMLSIPNGSSLRAKICQDGNKALMTNPNSALGGWLLRDVLGLKEEELLKYETLEEAGIDSVQVDKLSDGTYVVNFKELGTYDDFKIRELQGIESDDTYEE